jgi:serine/threonine protein kinase
MNTITLGHKEYEIISKISSQTTGCVYKAKRTDKEKYYALKEIPKGEYQTKIGIKMFTITERQNLDLALNANQIMAFLNDEGCKYVAKYHGHFETSTSHFLVSEWIEGQPIDVFTANLKDITLIRPMIKQLFQFIFKFHNRGLIHCDLHPKNILVCTGTNQIKIIDFGLSYDVNSPNLSCNVLRFDRTAAELKFRDLNRLKAIAIGLIYAPCNHPIAHDREMAMLDLALCAIKSEYSYDTIRDDICETLHI